MYSRLSMEYFEICPHLYTSLLWTHRGSYFAVPAWKMEKETTASRKSRKRTVSAPISERRMISVSDIDWIGSLMTTTRPNFPWYNGGQVEKKRGAYILSKRAPMYLYFENGVVRWLNFPVLGFETSARAFHTHVSFPGLSGKQGFAVYTNEQLIETSKTGDKVSM